MIRTAMGTKMPIRVSIFAKGRTSGCIFSSLGGPRENGCDSLYSSRAPEISCQREAAGWPVGDPGSLGARNFSTVCRVRTPASEFQNLFASASKRRRQLSHIVWLVSAPSSPSSITFPHQEQTLRNFFCASTCANSSDEVFTFPSSGLLSGGGGFVP